VIRIVDSGRVCLSDGTGCGDCVSLFCSHDEDDGHSQNTPVRGLIDPRNHDERPPKELVR
jgi:hypothetical protein